jgi:serine/threonine-protein kinase RIO1
MADRERVRLIVFGVETNGSMLKRTDESRRYYRQGNKRLRLQQQKLQMRQEVSWYQNEYQKMQKAPLLQTPERKQPGRVPYLEDIPTGPRQ